MNQSKKILISLALLFIIGPLIVFLFYSYSSNSYHKKETTPSSYRLDVDATELPKDYSGDNLEALYKELWSATYPKSNFEKTDEYKTRIQSAVEKYSNRVVIAQGGIHYEYDADKEELIGRVQPVQPSETEATTLVKPFYWRGAYDLIVPGRIKEVSFKLKLNPMRANKIVKSSLSLFLCKLTPFSSSKSLVPKLIEGDALSGNFYVQVDSVWLYSKATGEIYEKLKFKDIIK